MNNLKAQLGFKGERGYSAYEIAVQNGYEGTEQDWLATLGTSSHLTQETASYIATEGQTDFSLPSDYTSSTFVDVYVDGSRLTSDAYSISNNKVVLDTGLTTGQVLEIVEMTMSTNELPIVTEITSESTDDTAPSAKAVYGVKQTVASNTSSINTLTNNLETLSSAVTTLETSVTTNTSSISTLNTNLTEVSGKIANISEYSTNEKLVGKWIDGKPLYQKTLTGNTSYGGEITIDISSLHIDFIQFGPFSLKGGSNTTYPLEVWRSSEVYSHYEYNRSTGKLKIVTSNSPYMSGTYYLTIQYTKTTDVV